MIKNFLLILLRGYKKFISPLLGNHCRFTPSCSNYTYEAISMHGVIKGVLLGFLRIIRCQPLCKGGSDPIPKKFEVKIPWKRKI